MIELPPWLALQLAVDNVATSKIMGISALKILIDMDTPYVAAEHGDPPMEGGRV